MFTPAQLGVIQYCAIECDRQGSGELSVNDMLAGWQHASLALGWKRKVDIEFILELGRKVEPEDNKNGFRTVPIYVGNGWDNKPIGSPAAEIERHLALLIEAYYDGTLVPAQPLAKTAEDQFYFEYEGIHPFRDGNGRTGKILYNYLRDTMKLPEFPPNFWGISNP